MRKNNEQRMEEESKLVDWLENKFISSQNPLLLNSLFKNRKQFKKKKNEKR